MWLLDVLTYKLEQFYGNQIPKYAILSHRWEDEEVTFDQVASFPKHLKGWRKITQCCDQAKSRELHYVWIDTCCIDKKSSAELSEAINSMYKWYAGAEICLVYLYDVNYKAEMQDSSWFTRAWTLQELLAPPTVIFCNSSWQQVARLSRGAIRFDDDELIGAITGIPTVALSEFRPRDYSVATKMSWAAKRLATRDEDIAYSLLGIFEVNMPMLYGEGTKAFQRLQEEIIKVSNDLSIFVWSKEACEGFVMLARSPASFERRSGKLPLSEGFTVNNSGLSIKLFIQPILPLVVRAYLEDPKTIATFHDAESDGYQWRDSGIVFGDITSILLVKDGQDDQYTRAMDSNKANRGLRICDDIDRKKILSARLCHVRISRDPPRDLRKVWYLPELDHDRDLTASVLKFTISCVNDQARMYSSSSAELVTISTYLEVGQQVAIPCQPPPPAMSSTTMGIEYTKDRFVNIYFGFDFYFRPICLAQYCPDTSGWHDLATMSSAEIASEIAFLQMDDTSNRFITRSVIRANDEILVYRGQEMYYQTCHVQKIGLKIFLAIKKYGYHADLDLTSYE